MPPAAAGLLTAAAPTHRSDPTHPQVADDGYTIYLDGVTLPSDKPSSDSPASDGGDQPAPEIERGPVYVNEEGLDRFRWAAAMAMRRAAACCFLVAGCWLMLPLLLWLTSAFAACC
jgi:hypothetical protein